VNQAVLKPPYNGWQFAPAEACMERASLLPFYSLLLIDQVVEAGCFYLVSLSVDSQPNRHYLWDKLVMANISLQFQLEIKKQSVLSQRK
jgi:hypothetical protein